MSRAPVIGVMGGGDAPPRIVDLANELGHAVAEAGWVLLNGGRNAGVMAASARGAREGGGLVVGVLPGPDRAGSSPDLDVAVVTGMGNARNVINVLSSDVVVALPGGPGTLSEIALARKTGRPLVLLGWPEGAPADAAGADAVRAENVPEAIAAVRALLSQ
jgi:uncharacterized protein (TIGR00725 family)